MQPIVSVIRSTVYEQLTKKDTGPVSYMQQPTVDQSGCIQFIWAGVKVYFHFCFAIES